MAKRSSRDKIRHAAKMLSTDCDHMLEHLKHVSDIADHKSDYISENMYGLVEMVETLRHVFDKWRDGL